MPGINDKNREYWKKRYITWHKKKLFFDHEIKTGACYFCDREGKAQGSKSTALHHVIYNNDNPLEWTIEVCIKCHSKVDPNNLKQIQKSDAKRYFARAVDKEEDSIAIREYYSKPIKERWFEEQKKRENMQKEMKTSSYKRYF